VLFSRDKMLPIIARCPECDNEIVIASFDSEILTFTQIHPFSHTPQCSHTEAFSRTDCSVSGGRAGGDLFECRADNIKGSNVRSSV